MLRHKVRKNYRIALGFDWKNPDGSAMNLTGLTAKFILRADFTENDAAAAIASVNSGDVSSAASVTITSAVNGRVDVVIKTASTTQFVGGRDYFWELQLLDSGDIVKGVRGQFDCEGTI